MIVMDDVIEYMIHVFEEKYREIRRRVEEIINAGNLDTDVLREYSRLLKFKRVD